MAVYINYTKIYADKLKKELTRVSGSAARNFLLNRGYSASSFKLPDYYNPTGFKKISLKPIEWEKDNRNAVKITKTLDILTPKSYLSWRSFNFLNPYIYQHIVFEITKNENWKLIKKILTQETLVNSYSVPVFNLGKGETIAKKSVLNWLQMAEHDLIKDCPEYNYLIITDIKNFYPTIYTHSIGWALHGKHNMKSSSRGKYNVLGNKLDKLFQNSRDGQTNGIPVGSMVSDIIAEIILTDVDKKLSNKLEKAKVQKNVLVSRYRDDYRILAKSEDDGKKVLQYLNRVLQTEYDLNLNADKTEAHSDVIEGSLRPWMVEIKNSYLLRRVYYDDFSEKVTSNFLKDCLIETYRIQKKYMNGRASLIILSKLSEHLYGNISNFNIGSNDISEIISLLRKISLLREEATPQAVLLLDILLGQVKTKREKRKILTNLKKVVIGEEDQEYQLIWFYRLCLSQLPEMCKQILLKNNSPLLRVVGDGYYKNDFDIFAPANIAASDVKQLHKFNLIDRKKLNTSNNTSINPASLNIFKY